MLVLGATGGTGKRVVAQLSQRGLTVKAGTRVRLPYPAWQGTPAMLASSKVFTQ